MYYTYVRVSTDKQTTENQLLEVQKYCRNKGIPWDKITIVKETVSGTKEYSKRQLGKLIKILNPGDVLIVTELSRLGRNLMMIFDILNQLLQKNVRVHAIKENYELGNNIQSQVLAFAFGLSAQIERDLLSQRTKCGLERAKTEGKHVGRRKGELRGYILEGKEREIKQMIHGGLSKRKIAEKYHIGITTLYNFIKIKGLY